MSASKPNRGPRVTIERLCRAYAAAVALDDVSLDIPGGQYVALVGMSGSGKSTLIRAINRLIVPDSGRVQIGEHDATPVDTVQLRRRIGHVIQGVGLFPHMTVAANIAIGLRIAGERDTKARVTALLDLVDLPHDLVDRSPATLSGGQRQRVGIARALAPAPGLMLLDEPFGALDPLTRDALGRAYRALHDRLGLTSIMVTHDIAEALLLADRVVVMAAGRIVGDATPAALLRGEGGAKAQALVAVPQAQMARLAKLQ